MYLLFHVSVDVFTGKVYFYKFQLKIVYREGKGNGISKPTLKPKTETKAKTKAQTKTNMKRKSNFIIWQSENEDWFLIESRYHAHRSQWHANESELLKWQMGRIKCINNSQVVFTIGYDLRFLHFQFDILLFSLSHRSVISRYIWCFFLWARKKQQTHTHTQSVCSTTVNRGVLAVSLSNEFYRFIFIYASRSFFPVPLVNNIIGSRLKRGGSPSENGNQQRISTESNELLLRIETNYGDYFNRRMNRYKITFWVNAICGQIGEEKKKMEKIGWKNQEYHTFELTHKNTLHSIVGWNKRNRVIP